MKNDSNARVVITNDDDTTTLGEAELDLIVGSNTLTVTVTSEDGIITKPYRVTVTRANALGICGRTPAVRDALVARISVISDCAYVTDVHLAAITGTLDLGNQNITALAAGDFAGLTSLQTLQLNDNELTTLPDNVFDGLTSLQILRLNDNALATLPDDVFAGLTSLTVLRLTDNALDRLPAGVFDNLTALEILRLDDNDLTELPAGVFDNLTALTTLALDDNALGRLLPDDVFEPLTLLTDLRLSGNPGVPFAPEAVALGTVSLDVGTVTLDGSGSGGAWGTNVFYSWALTDPASGVSGVSVSFDDNTSVTPQVTIITPLAADTELTFTLRVTVTGRGGASGIDPGTDTATVTANATIGGICGRTPAVRDAILGRIPSVSSCAAVTGVHLADITGTLALNALDINALAAGDFAGLTALTSLYLNDNALTTLPDDVFDGLTALETLHLNDNALTTLPENVFESLTALETLHLNDNDLSTLPDDVFEPLTSLKTLVLADNALTTLPDNVFDGLTALETLHLNDNDLTTLPENVFEPLTALTTLWLQGNPQAPFTPNAVALARDEIVPKVGGTVMLDASTGTGPWGTNVTYSWVLSTPMNGVTFDDNLSAMPMVTIPALALGTELTFTLTVTGRGGTNGITPATDTATVTTQASDVATLESLTVNDGTNDLALVPSFAPGAFSYTVEVLNPVTTVMLTAGVTEADASVTAVTLSDAPIVDTNFTDGITVPSLVVGNNTIVVTVLAEAGNTQTYTVIVTRAAVATAATVTDVAFTSLPSDNFYDLGEIVEVSVTFSEAVDVSGTPRVGLRFGSFPEFADHVVSASTPTLLVFRHTVTGARDGDTNGILVAPNGLDLNGGTIHNQGTGVDANLAHGGSTGLPSRTRLVESIGVASMPQVLSANTGGVSIYGPGEVIKFTVAFGDTVNVSGMPVLKLSTDEGSFDAAYASGTGTQTLQFNWTVPNTLPDRSSIRILTNISGSILSSIRGLLLQGAMLTDSGDRPVNIRHAENLNLAVYADGAPPVLFTRDSGATVNAERLELIYRINDISEDADWLDMTSTPAPGDFTVMVDGTEVTVSTVEIVDEESVRLTLSQAVQSGDVVTIDYTPGANPIKDLWGNEAIAVNSRAVRNDTAASSDATLSALTAHDGTNELTLDPPFASGMFAYTTPMANAIARITLTATPTDANGSVSTVTLNGSAISDPDFADGIAVPSLLEGDNTIALTATAQNGATQIYTMTVTRAAADVGVTIVANHSSIGAGLEGIVFTLTRTGPTTDALDVTMTIDQEQPWLSDSALSLQVRFDAGRSTTTHTIHPGQPCRSNPTPPAP